MIWLDLSGCTIGLCELVAVGAVVAALGANIFCWNSEIIFAWFSRSRRSSSVSCNHGEEEEKSSWCWLFLIILWWRYVSILYHSCMIQWHRFHISKRQREIGSEVLTNNFQRSLFHLCEWERVCDREVMRRCATQFLIRERRTEFLQ